MKFESLLILPLLVSSLQAASVSDLTFTVASEAGPPPLGDSTEYSVTSCRTNASGSLNIPSTYNGLPVTSIAPMAFINCTNLTSITIPDSVAFIGGGAFENCTSLTSINIPDNVSSIETVTFKGCTSLASITIPDGVTFGYGGGAFENCTSLTSINIPDSVTSIESRTFSGCTSLVSVTMPDGVPFIGAPHFTNGDYIGYEAFSNCTSLTSITIPAGVTDIGGEAFSNCISLTSITIPAGVTDIGGGAFSNCTSLTSITLPDRVYYIAGSAFNNCISLASINIPDGVTSIGGAAFSHCSSLTSITIPDSVTSIGQNAFSHCSSLASITFNGNAPTAGGLLFVDIPSDAIISYYAYATGFSSPTWQGLETNIIDQPEPDTDSDGIDDDKELSDSLQYELIEGNYSFLDAKADAVNRGGRLAILDSSEKVSSAQSVLLNNNSYIWIGLERAGNQWRWINGSLLDDDIANWAPSEPNNVGGSEDYVEIYGQNLYWNDDDENEKKSYLIEHSSYITDPNLADSDGDGLTDGEEFSVYYTNPTISDTDGDEINDGDEVLSYSTNPNLEDTSGDGLGDGVVVNAGFDPTVDYSNLVISSRQGMTDLRAGSTIIQVTNNEASIQIQMEESSDLESWTETGDAATMVVPADSDTKFYRFKMTE